MRIDQLIKVLFAIVIILIGLTAIFGYHLYNNLCNNEEVYTAVEQIDSADAYGICGNNFGIVNVGDSQILVTKLDNINQDVKSEEIDAATVATNTVLVDSGDTLPMDASDQVRYQISNPLGSNLEHQIEVRKF